MASNKKLSEMSNEELWRLFPIFVTAHSEGWETQYLEEEKRLRTFLPLDGMIISHIGSTAVKAIWAKPIVDILLEIPQGASMEIVKDSLAGNGYLCINEEETLMDFNKGYTQAGFADVVFHLHLRYWGDNDELYFRDYLNDNEAIAKEYEKMKLLLWKRYEQDRDAYTNAKGDFIKEQTQAAKRAYGERYGRK